MAKILIAMPTAGDIKLGAAKGIIDAVAVVKDKTLDIEFNYFKGYQIDANRNAIVDYSIRNGFDYVMMVDSDTVIPKNTIKIMLETLKNADDVKLIAGWQKRKLTTTEQTECFIEDGQRDFVEVYKTHELENMKEPITIKGTGFGCVMIKVEFLSHLKNKGIKPFNYVIYEDGGRLSEDNWFCWHVKNEGFKLMVNPQLRCGHIWEDTY